MTYGRSIGVLWGATSIPGIGLDETETQKSDCD